MIRIIPFAHATLEAVIDENSITVDMTAGNGNDALFLARRSQMVYAFDVQKTALDRTRALLEENGIDNVKLICDSHETLEKYVEVPIRAAVFNLGYLPGGAKTCVTTAASTLAGLAAALKILETGGIVSLTLYTGHPGGAEEATAVSAYAKTLDAKRYAVSEYRVLNRTNAPFVIIIHKL